MKYVLTLESYESLQKLWKDSWDIIRTKDPSKYNHLKIKYNLKDDQTKGEDIQPFNYANYLHDVNHIAKRLKNKPDPKIERV